jgi:NAD(P)-dependent dehydrogenase (short-subunit alcohol dehydrogenase family)
MLSGMKRLAVVTGAQGGIGRAIVAGLVAEGTAVAAFDLDPGVADLERLGTSEAPVHPQRVDLRDAAECQAAARQVVETLGPPEILINNAGVMHKKSLVDHTIEDWDLEFAVNVRPAFVLCQLLVPPMAQRGHGIVVNTASIWASRGGPDRVAYIAAKHAMVGLTRALAAEYGPAGVRINAVSPGPARTPMTEGLGGNQDDWMGPEEVADVIVFLCSDRAAGITGTNVEIPGRGQPAGL